MACKRIEYHLVYSNILSRCNCNNGLIYPSSIHKVQKIWHLFSFLSLHKAHEHCWHTVWLCVSVCTYSIDTVTGHRSFAYDDGVHNTQLKILFKVLRALVKYLEAHFFVTISPNTATISVRLVQHGKHTPTLALLADSVVDWKFALFKNRIRKYNFSFVIIIVTSSYGHNAADFLFHFSCMRVSYSNYLLISGIEPHTHTPYMYTYRPEVGLAINGCLRTPEKGNAWNYRNGAERMQMRTTDSQTARQTERDHFECAIRSHPHFNRVFHLHNRRIDNNMWCLKNLSADRSRRQRDQRCARSF